MKKYFYIGITSYLLFELLILWMIMPFPGSQQNNTVEMACFLFKWRWYFRGFFYLIMAIGLISARFAKDILSFILLAVCMLLPVFINLKLSASAMFREMKSKTWAGIADNKVHTDKLVLGIEINGVARAYPIQILAYHHHLVDTVDNKVIMVTYCSVCRTGRVFEPIVNGKQEQFRLVGMDHFNAMFEDETTKSWWRQVNGMAVAGPLKGQCLPEIPYVEMNLNDWLALHPDGKVLQPDPAFAPEYSALENYENGTIDNRLEKTDTISWNEKSLVLGIELGSQSKVYDWNTIKKKKYLLDEAFGKRIILWLNPKSDASSAWYLPEDILLHTDSCEVIQANVFHSTHFNITPKGKLQFTQSGQEMILQPVKTSLEFWHSWRTFHPVTTIYSDGKDRINR